MKKVIIIAATMLFASAALAQSGTPGSSTSAPGQQMPNAQKTGASGATETAPDQKTQNDKKSASPGASWYGQRTTTDPAATKK